MAQEVSRASTLREAVGVFDSYQAVETAVRELLTSGFDRADVSILAAEETVRSKLGPHYQDTHAAEDDPAAPRSAWVQPESHTVGKSAAAGILGYIGAVGAGMVIFATGGVTALAVAAGVVGAGIAGGVGYRLAQLIDDQVARNLQSRLELGGIIVWVRVDNQGEEFVARDRLTGCGAQDVHIHEIRLPQ